MDQMPTPVAVTLPPASPIDHQVERLHIVRDLLTKLMLFGSAIALAFGGYHDLSLMVFGGALTFAVPGPSSARMRAGTALAAMVAIGMAVGTSGCAAAGAVGTATGVIHTVAQGTCLVCSKLEQLGVCEQPCSAPECADAGTP